MKEEEVRSDLRTRTMTIALFLPLFVILVFLSRWTLMALFVALSFLAFQEYWRIATGETKPVVLVLSGVVLFWTYASLWIGEGKKALGWYGLLLAVLFWAMKNPREALDRVSLFLLGSLYCIFLPIFWVKTGLEFSPKILFFFALLVWTNDILAYLLGRKWGGHKIIPLVSPGKSWEGFFGGMGGAILCSILLGTLWVGLPLKRCLIFGIVLPPVAFLGDIFESALKRRIGAKDSGKFFPGHGGILDRFDSFFLAGPLVYLLISLGKG